MMTEGREALSMLLPFLGSKKSYSTRHTSKANFETSICITILSSFCLSALLTLICANPSIVVLAGTPSSARGRSIVRGQR